jgi:hypothetical protein
MSLTYAPGPVARFVDKVKRDRGRKVAWSIALKPVRIVAALAERGDAVNDRVHNCNLL